MKPHYFDDPAGAANDMWLNMAKGQGYVPKGCLLGGNVVMAETNAGRDACASCNGPREKCGGRPKSAVRKSSSSGTAPTVTDGGSAEAGHLTEQGLP